MPQCLASVIVRARNTVADSHLVESFARSADPEAFAELVRRHGPMVLGVCRKITRHAHDAEDAAQAAFLVLARRAASIDPNGLASWLFGVAVNTAREARRRTGRRREVLSATLPESTRFDPEPDFDTRAAIAEELAQLPDRYRELVVRCDLEGESQAAVARRVGLPVGTVYSRLSTARTILAGRLTRRGIAAGVAVLAVPRIGAAFVVSDRPSSRVTELTEAVMRTGIAVRWKWLAVFGLTVGIAFGADGRAERAEAPMPRPKAESRLAIGLRGQVRFVTPDGADVGRVTGGDAKRAGADMQTGALMVGLSSKTLLKFVVHETFTPHGRIAPDGRMPLHTRKGFYLLTPGGTAEPVRAADGTTMFAGKDVPQVVAWSADGRRAVVMSRKGGIFGRETRHNSVVDLAAGTVTPLPLPDDHGVVDWSPDGSWFLTVTESRTGKTVDGLVVCKTTADGKSVTQLSEPGKTAAIAALSPDGKTAAFMYYHLKKPEPVEGVSQPNLWASIELVAVDVASGARRVLVNYAGRMRPDGTTCQFMPGEVRWSPDGSRIAFAHNVWESRPWPTTEWRLTTIAPDGTDTKTIMTITRGPDGEAWEPYRLIDWR